MFLRSFILAARRLYSRQGSLSSKMSAGCCKLHLPWTFGADTPTTTSHNTPLAHALQEEDEQSYQQHFPDHFSAFADVAELDDMPNLGDDSMVAGAAAAAAEADSGLTEAEASSNAAQQLLHGAILSDVVGLHARYVCN